MKRLLPVIEQQKTRDVSEADTVTLVKDLLSEVFGYDKYRELTSEFAIRGTYCDLTIRVADKITHIVEVKSIGIALDDRHVKQAIDYAANQGTEWVMLTNAIMWRLYHVVFAKPIDKELVAEIDLTTLDCRKDESLDQLYLFTKEGFSKGAQIEVRDRRAALSRFMLAALLLNNDSILSAMRRELRRVADVQVEPEEIAKILSAEVIKREAMEGTPAAQATALVNKAESKQLRAAKAEAAAESEPAASPVTPAEPEPQK